MSEVHPASDLVALLEQDALRNIVLLKHLTAFPGSTRGHRAFRIHGQVWEVGGVFTSAPFRGRGLAGRVVRTALAVLRERCLTPRYQASADNAASIALAESVGLRHFLTLTHHLHRPPEP